MDCILDPTDKRRGRHKEFVCAVSGCGYSTDAFMDAALAHARRAHGVRVERIPGMPGVGREEAFAEAMIVTDCCRPAAVKPLDAPPIPRERLIAAYRGLGYTEAEIAARVN